MLKLIGVSIEDDTFHEKTTITNHKNFKHQTVVIYSKRD